MAPNFNYSRLFWNLTTLHDMNYDFTFHCNLIDIGSIYFWKRSQSWAPPPCSHLFSHGWPPSPLVLTLFMNGPLAPIYYGVKILARKGLSQNKQNFISTDKSVVKFVIPKRLANNFACLTKDCGTIFCKIAIAYQKLNFKWALHQRISWNICDESLRGKTWLRNDEQA